MGQDWWLHPVDRRRGDRRRCERRLARRDARDRRFTDRRRSNALLLVIAPQPRSRG